jgi:hypothetical protein
MELSRSNARNYHQNRNKCPLGMKQTKHILRNTHVKRNRIKYVRLCQRTQTIYLSKVACEMKSEGGPFFFVILFRGVSCQRLEQLQNC